MSLVDGAGCWLQIERDAPHRAAGRAALFLDRDGVLVEEPGYLGQPENVRMIPGAATAVAAFNRASVPVTLVTNQAGVARGRFDWADFRAVQDVIHARLAEAGARLDAVAACGFHEAGNGALAVAGHPWRKPGSGMLTAVAGALGIDLARSWIVGDKAIDLEAGRAAGLAGGVHVLTGHGSDPAERVSALALVEPGFRTLAARDLAEALDALKAAFGIFE